MSIDVSPDPKEVARMQAAYYLEMSKVSPIPESRERCKRRYAEVVYTSLCASCRRHIVEKHQDHPAEATLAFVEEGSSEDCLYAEEGCGICGESHESICGTPPEDPCDSAFVKEIST